MRDFLAKLIFGESSVQREKRLQDTAALLLAREVVLNQYAVAVATQYTMLAALATQLGAVADVSPEQKPVVH